MVNLENAFKLLGESIAIIPDMELCRQITNLTSEAKRCYTSSSISPACIQQLIDLMKSFNTAENFQTGNSVSSADYIVSMSVSDYFKTKSFRVQSLTDKSIWDIALGKQGGFITATFFDSKEIAFKIIIETENNQFVVIFDDGKSVIRSDKQNYPLPFVIEPEPNVFNLPDLPPSIGITSFVSQLTSLINKEDERKKSAIKPNSSENAEPQKPGYIKKSEDSPSSQSLETKTKPKFCHQCGTELRSGAKFCESCGNRI